MLGDVHFPAGTTPQSFWWRGGGGRRCSALHETFTRFQTELCEGPSGPNSNQTVINSDQNGLEIPTAVYVAHAYKLVPDKGIITQLSLITSTTSMQKSCSKYKRKDYPL